MRTRSPSWHLLLECAGVSLVYWPLQTIMCAKLVRMSRERKYIVRKYQAKNTLSGGPEIERKCPSHQSRCPGGCKKSCLIWSEVLLTINFPTVEEFELFNSFTIAFYLQSKSNKSTHMGFVACKQKYPLFNQLMKTFLHRYRCGWPSVCVDNLVLRAE